MNQTNSGNSELEIEGVFADRWGEVSAILEDYLVKIKAKIPGGSAAAEKALNMPFEQIKTLAHEECAEYAVALSQYSYFLQQELNYHQSKLDWCQATITYVASNYGNSEEDSRFFSAIKREHQISKLAHTSKSIKSLIQMSAIAKNMTNILNGLSYKVSNLSDVFISLQQSKRRLNG